MTIDGEGKPNKTQGSKLKKETETHGDHGIVANKQGLENKEVKG